MSDKERDITEIHVPEPVLEKWQGIVDVMAELVGVPAGLVMRIAQNDIEVFVSSQTEGNPYRPGNKEHLFGSGLYCETVIQTKNRLLVPNALLDKDWRNNPDVKLNMISYLGFPILLPNGNPFGTICVLDHKENSYSQTYERLILQLRDTIQGQLEILFMNHVLGEENKKLKDYITEIKTLRAILPICSKCKKIRDDEGYRHEVELYISAHSETLFSHGICPQCAQSLYPEFYDE
ncbi:MAG: GAF domain-containing protein [Desulfomonile tiedjei]|nr:GAF domain-containing protein [Desulfomonile tiedjei]